MNKYLKSIKQFIVSLKSGADEEKQNDATSNETVEQQCPSGANDPSAVMTEEQERQIAERYDCVGSFHDGLAHVEIYGKYGFIDKTGKEIIPLIYDDAYSFSEGLAVVKLNSKWGFIDTTGKEVVPLKYDWAGSFSEGLASVNLNGKWGYIDKTGKEVIPLKYDWVGSFSEGLVWVKLNGKYGYIDKSGKEVIPLKYDVAGIFSEGLARVKLNGKYGYIDKSGKAVIPLKYDDACFFSEGLACVELNDKYGFIDQTGKEVIPLKYDLAGDFSKRLVRVKLNGKYGFINKTGKEVIPLIYDDSADYFIQGLVRVKLNGREFYINKTGKEVTPLQDNKTEHFFDGLASAKSSSNKSKEKQPFPPEYQMKIFMNQFNREQLLDILNDYILQGNHYDLIGTSFRNLGEYDLSEKAYLRAIELSPELENPYANLLSLYILQDKYWLCDEIYHKGMRNVTNANAQSAIVFQDGRLQFAKGNYQLALSAARSVLNVEKFQHEGAFVLALHSLLSLIKQEEDVSDNCDEAIKLWTIGISIFSESEELKELSKYFTDEE
jgi:tetratricopeptide (TPR) repeat protein